MAHVDNIHELYTYQAPLVCQQLRINLISRHGGCCQSSLSTGAHIETCYLTPTQRPHANLNLPCHEASWVLYEPWPKLLFGDYMRVMVIVLKGPV